MFCLGFQSRQQAQFYELTFLTFLKLGAMLITSEAVWTLCSKP